MFTTVYSNLQIFIADNLTSCCLANNVPENCLGHCVVDYSNGYRKLEDDEEKAMNMGLCKGHSNVIKECQKRGISNFEIDS